MTLRTTIDIPIPKCHHNMILAVYITFVYFQPIFNKKSKMDLVITFTGKALGRYNIYLGASFTGDRMNKLYRENIGEEEILNTLKPIIQRFAQERQEGEHFGDFVIRAGYVNAIYDGKEYNH